jgi:hypothetical protein
MARLLRGRTDFSRRINDNDVENISQSGRALAVRPTKMPKT